MQYQSSCAPKPARKCEIEHWLPCGADKRAVYSHVITKFSRMGRFTYPWCSAARARALLLFIYLTSSVVFKSVQCCVIIWYMRTLRKQAILEVNDRYVRKKKIPDQFLVLEQQYQYDLHQVWPTKQTQDEALITKSKSLILPFVCRKHRRKKLVITIAILKPKPGSPSRFSFGTLQFSKIK